MDSSSGPGTLNTIRVCAIHLDSAAARHHAAFDHKQDLAIANQCTHSPHSSARSSLTARPGEIQQHFGAHAIGHGRQFRETLTMLRRVPM